MTASPTGEAYGLTKFVKHRLAGKRLSFIFKAFPSGGRHKEGENIMFNEFINEYGTAILYALIMGVFGYLGLLAKKYFDKYFDSKEKRDVASSCVQFVEQVYKDLHGEEKLDKAIEAASEMLAQKGIVFTELELRVLIEAAVASFNDAFDKGGTK